LRQSLIFLLGAGGVDRSTEHAAASAELATAMDPEYLSALTLMLVPTTPIAQLADRGDFELPDVDALLRELRIIVAETNCTETIFRSNHASNYLPIGGRLPRDRAGILTQIDAALSGEAPTRPDWSRGL
jgi:coproporphyrinogen III oxidase-like Fe-S oxidoreductase